MQKKILRFLFFDITKNFLFTFIFLYFFFSEYNKMGNIGSKQESRKTNCFRLIDVKQALKTEKHLTTTQNRMLANLLKWPPLGYNFSVRKPIGHETNYAVNNIHARLYRCNYPLSFLLTLNGCKTRCLIYFQQVDVDFLKDTYHLEPCTFVERWHTFLGIEYSRDCFVAK